MAFSPQAVANYLLELGERDDVDITPMKMQKLVYYAHGWHLGITGEPLINEQIECWPYGPVVRSLFHAFKPFDSAPITAKATKLRARKLGEPSSGIFRTITPLINKDADALETIDAAWNSYKGFSPIRLSNMTHAEGEPWRTVFDEWKGQPPRGTDIPSDVIRDYFKAKLKVDE